MNFKFYRAGLMSLTILLLFFSQQTAKAQFGRTHWAADGYQYYRIQGGQITELDTRDSVKKTVLVTKEMLTPTGGKPLNVENFYLSGDGTKTLLFTNSKRVWRYNTRGDYWVYDMTAKTLKQIGKDRPASSLMFAKLSPDGTKAGYVSEHNIYVEDLATGNVKQLNTDGT